MEPGTSSVLKSPILQGEVWRPRVWTSSALKFTDISMKGVRRIIDDKFDTSIVMDVHAPCCTTTLYNDLVVQRPYNDLVVRSLTLQQPCCTQTQSLLIVIRLPPDLYTGSRDDSNGFWGFYGETEQQGGKEEGSAKNLK